MKKKSSPIVPRGAALNRDMAGVLARGGFGGADEALDLYVELWAVADETRRNAEVAQALAWQNMVALLAAGEIGGQGS